jgi:CCR4-NOT transcription complex subunit 2
MRGHRLGVSYCVLATLPLATASLLTPIGSRPQQVDASPEEGAGDKTSEGSRNTVNAASGYKFKEDKTTQPPKPVDPLEGMSQDDRYGLKGLRTMMNSYPDYHATVVGIDPVTLGLDLSFSE